VFPPNDSKKCFSSSTLAAACSAAVVFADRFSDRAGQQQQRKTFPRESCAHAPGDLTTFFGVCYTRTNRNSCRSVGCSGTSHLVESLALIQRDVSLCKKFLAPYTPARRGGGRTQRCASVGFFLFLSAGFLLSCLSLWDLQNTIQNGHTMA
jgi:hypothetical protein